MESPARGRVATAGIDGTRPRIVVLVLLPDHDFPLSVTLDNAAVNARADRIRVPAVG